MRNMSLEQRIFMIQYYRNVENSYRFLHIEIVKILAASCIRHCSIVVVFKLRNLSIYEKLFLYTPLCYNEGVRIVPNYTNIIGLLRIFRVFSKKSKKNKTEICHF